MAIQIQKHLRIKKYSRILDGRTPMSADMFIDLNPFENFHQVKQKSLRI